MQRPLTATVNLKLRLEERLRRQLEREARKADRSMNAEIIDRLEKSFVEPALLQRIDSVVKSDNVEVARRLAELQSTLDKVSSTLHRPADNMPPMSGKASTEISLKDFSWSRDPKGFYRLRNDAGVQRIFRSKPSPEEYKPFETHENLLGEFARMQSPIGVLAFVKKFGPLTDEGMDVSKGENVTTARQQAQLMSKVLRATKHEHYPFDVPTEPKLISLTMRFGASGPEGPFLKLEPRTLLDAIWLQLSQALAGDGEIRHCAHCGVWFVAGGESGRRQDAKFCSDEHRIAYNNEKRAAGKN